MVKMVINQAVKQVRKRCQNNINALPKRFLFIILLVSNLTVMAQERGFFFEISKDNKTAYIFGTTHGVGFLKLPLRPEVEAVLNHSKCIAKELQPNDPTTATSILPLLRLPEKTVLSEVLTPETTNRLRLFLEKYRYLPTVLEPFKPYVAADSLGFLKAKSSPSSTWGTATQSLDDYLVERSRSKQIPLFGIETVKEQLELKDSLTFAEQEAVLLEVLESVENSAEVNQWYSSQFEIGDIQALREGYIEKQSHIPSLGIAINKYIFSRNKTQAERINKMIDNGSECVFAVGALHLGGKNGVVNLLNRFGYKVRQF
jgi:uncharacterized protein